MDRSGRIGEEIREAKPKPQPPSGAGKEPNPATEETLLPEGARNPSEDHPPEDPAKTTPS